MKPLAFHLRDYASTIVGRTTGWWIFQTTTCGATWVLLSSYGLSVLGIVLGGISGIAISLVLEGLARREERPVTEMVYCSYCGTGNVKNAVYRKKRGKKFS